MVKLTDSKIVTHAKLLGEKKWHSQASCTVRAHLAESTENWYLKCVDMHRPING